MTGLTQAELLDIADRVSAYPSIVRAIRGVLLPDTPAAGLDAEYERRLTESALRFFGDQMLGYAAAAGLSQEDFKLVAKDVEAVRALLAARLAKEPIDQ